ncbi:MAG: AAA family ATPase [Dehalococcoidia bacterium]|nr:AAA family ATPase [Dehalococcoidia bacterium]
MYLKRLSVQGFKSFANRTQFEYGRGITAVVGPNGSGKSNVSDAIRWVLGEQSSKLLRAKKQEDVIFSGTKDRAAVGMAEVALTLDNEGRWLPVDFAEVEIARRVYRNGDSEYLLNGSRVRLRDVIDLLMKGDVGQNSYSIMGQGLVDEVLSMSPDERRSFLDEAADVKRFRLKIREAQDRLSATRDNIDRVSLIIDEIEPRLAHLSRQAERAAEHKRLSAELLDLLKTYYGHQWNEAQNALVRVRAELDQGTAENTAAAQRVTQLREQLRALSDEIRKRREAIGRRDTRNSEIDQRLATAEQALVLDRERHNMVSSRREEVRMELEAIEAERLSLASTDVDDGRRGIEVVGEAETAREGMQRTRQELDAAEREYSTLRSRSQELHDGADGDDRRANAMDSDIESAQRRIADLERELEQLVARRKQIIVELIGYGRRYCEARASVAEGEINLEAARREADSAREQLVRVQEEVREFESSGNQDLRELDHLEGRLDALSRVQAEHDGVAAGTRNVLIMGQALMDEFAPGSMGEPPEVPGVVGLLSRQIKVPAGLEVAINAALEQRLHAVVVENETVALEAIGALQRRKQGRAQFMPLDSVRHVYPLNLQKERGVVGVASKLIRCENRVKQLVDTLLGRVIIVEDVQSGLRMVKRALGSVVTLDGVYIEQTGVMAGGSTGADEGEFIRQRELEELPERIEELRKRTEVSAERVADARAAIEQVAKRSHETEAEYEMTRRSLEGARFDLERERERLHRLRRDMDTVYSKRADIERERAGRESQILQARTAAIQLQQRRDERRAAMEAPKPTCNLRPNGAKRRCAPCPKRVPGSPPWRANAGHLPPFENSTRSPSTGWIRRSRRSVCRPGTSSSKAASSTNGWVSSHSNSKTLERNRHAMPRTPPRTETNSTALRTTNGLSRTSSTKRRPHCLRSNGGGWTRSRSWHAPLSTWNTCAWRWSAKGSRRTAADRSSHSKMRWPPIRCFRRKSWRRRACRAGRKSMSRGCVLASRNCAARSAGSARSTPRPPKTSASSRSATNS